MAVIRVVTWRLEMDAERAAALEKAGFQVQFGLVEGGAVWRAIRNSPPDLVLIELAHRPSHGRELGRMLRTTKATQTIRLVFVGGEEEKVHTLRGIFPDCPFVPWRRAVAAIRKAIAKGPTPPATVPKPHMQVYSGRPLVLKLGIKPGMRVLALNAPEGWDGMISELPERAGLVSADPADLAICFLDDRAALLREAKDIARRAGKCPVWTAYPKQQRGRQVSDLTQTELRETLLGLGLTDYKVCSMDDRWTALLWTRAKVR